MINIFFDMDGVLVEYTTSPIDADYYSRGFFTDLPPVKEMLAFARSLMSDYNIYIASTLLWYDERYSP